MVKTIFATLLLFFAPRLQAQSQHPDSFTAFANHYDSLFHEAYTHRDTACYQQLLDTFILRYNTLDSATQKASASHLFVALYNLCCTYRVLNNQQQAIAYLERSIQAGYYNYINMMADPDLTNIRPLEKFSQLLAPLRRIGDMSALVSNSIRLPFRYMVRIQCLVNNNLHKSYYQTRTRLHNFEMVRASIIVLRYSNIHYLSMPLTLL